MKTDFNGYSFANPEIRKRMKYIIIEEGDLDLNNAYAFKSKKDLKIHLKYEMKWYSEKVEAIFKIEDITSEELKKPQQVLD